MAPRRLLGCCLTLYECSCFPLRLARCAVGTGSSDVQSAGSLRTGAKQNTTRHHPKHLKDCCAQWIPIVSDISLCFNSYGGVCIALTYGKLGARAREGRSVGLDTSPAPQGRNRCLSEAILERYFRCGFCSGCGSSHPKGVPWCLVASNTSPGHPACVFPSRPPPALVSSCLHAQGRKASGRLINPPSLSCPSRCGSQQGNSSLLPGGLMSFKATSQKSHITICLLCADVTASTVNPAAADLGYFIYESLFISWACSSYHEGSFWWAETFGCRNFCLYQSIASFHCFHGRLLHPLGGQALHAHSCQGDGRAGLVLCAGAWCGALNKSAVGRNMDSGEWETHRPSGQG